ncbi:MAG: nucleotidyltransferase domain-containing protein [Nanoarchaeota archaeon]
MDKIKELFIQNPEKEYYVREISRLVGKSPTTISKKLKELTKKKFLIFRNELNHSLYKSNNEHEEYKQEKIFYNLNRLKESGLVNFLIKEYNYPEAIILFGSFAKGEDNKNSDVDLAVISPSEKKINLEKFKTKLRKDIQLFVLSEKEIINMKTKNKELLNNLLNGIKLYGFWEIF